MLGLNPGKVTRQVHDDILTRWVYETNDTVEQILASDNYLVYLNHAPAKINAGDEIIIRSKTVDNEFNMITLIVGYSPAEESFFPIYLTKVNVHTGEVSILTGLEEYLEDSEGDDSADESGCS